MTQRQVVLQSATSGGRLDRFLADQIPGLSRSAARRLIDGGQVLVDGAPAKASLQVRPGACVVASLPADGTDEIVAEALPLEVVYEDEALLVVNKPAGMVVHPAPGHRGGTLANALLAHCPELAAAGGDRPGIVHRLDRDTSGLILVAKSETVRRVLQRQFHDRQVEKVYLALLEGHIQPAWARIEAPIGRDPHHRQRMAILPGGREAVTEYRVLESFARGVGPATGDYTLVEAQPKTGRTHQIRVHFASIGHAVVGDRVYGRRQARLAVPRQCLHAVRLGFLHPTTGERCDLTAPVPDDLSIVLDLLRGH